MKGVIFYTGKSRIDGSPIVGIATFSKGNAKTGKLVSTWIIRSDIHPMDAINTGADKSVCGNCPLRGEIRPASERLVKGKFGGETVNKGRSCYVNVGQAPSRVYEAYKRGNYVTLTAEHAKHFAGRGLRFGSYGDPVAIPLQDWKLLESLCTGKTKAGYTHQWANGRFKAWRKKLMASTHTEAENELAHAAGWRTFRTIMTLESKTGAEIICPASKERGHVATCETCGACNGRKSEGDGRASVSIVAHGGSGKPERVAEASRRVALQLV